MLKFIIASEASLLADDTDFRVRFAGVLSRNLGDFIHLVAVVALGFNLSTTDYDLLFL